MNSHSATAMLVRFYVLPNADRSARLNLACQLCEKAQAAGQKGVILCEDEKMRAELDALLWAFRAESFIPHTVPDNALAEDATVLLLVPPERVQSSDMVINLSHEPRIDIPRACNRVFEIVTTQPDVLEITRQRFSAYRERGLQPQTHKLKS